MLVGVVVAGACPRPERRVCRPKCVALLVVIDAAKIGASLKKAVDIVVPGGRGSDQISLAFKVDLLPGYVRFQCGEVRCVICYPVRVEARERVSRAPKNTERLFNTAPIRRRSAEHTSELQSLMRISYAVFCLKKKTDY